MRRILCLVLLVVAGVLVPETSRADGKVFSSVTVAEPVRIPDQRAILSWSEGIERLVIETRFSGRGSNFAWVVPLPARPVVEPVSPGLFTTLVELILHDAIGGIRDIVPIQPGTTPQGQPIP
ncbi:MAG: hypothetical protein ACKO3H_09745 [Verrucomicrobiota bacterium]